MIYTVSEKYVTLVDEVQKAMQREVADKGISIECNPTSNYLIGTFKNFKRHPIFNWNSFGLPAFGDSPMLHISVNTDDQGVFAGAEGLEGGLGNDLEDTVDPLDDAGDGRDDREDTRRDGVDHV